MNIIKDFTLFRAEVDKYKRVNNLTNWDVANRTGYGISSIEKFMSENTDRNSEKVAQAISKALKIPL